MGKRYYHDFFLRTQFIEMDSGNVTKGFKFRKKNKLYSEKREIWISTLGV